jgi:hypothetical protein
MGGNGLGNQQYLETPMQGNFKIGAMNPQQLQMLSPQERYAYQQAAAQQQIKPPGMFTNSAESGQQILPSNILEHNRAILKQYFPNIKF